MPTGTRSCAPDLWLLRGASGFFAVLTGFETRAVVRRTPEAALEALAGQLDRMGLYDTLTSAIRDLDAPEGAR